MLSRSSISTVPAEPCNYSSTSSRVVMPMGASGVDDVCGASKTLRWVLAKELSEKSVVLVGYTDEYIINGGFRPKRTPI